MNKKNWSLQNFFYWFTVTICLIIIFSTCHIQIGPDRPTPEQQMEDTLQVEHMPVKGDRRIEFINLPDRVPSIKDCFQYGKRDGEYFAGFGDHIVACKDTSDAKWTIIDSASLKRGIAALLMYMERIREKEVDNL